MGRRDLGYRSIVDTAPFLALAMIPLIEQMLANRGTRLLFGVLLAWSVAVQFVGAYSYSLMGWSDLWREYGRPEQASLWQWKMTAAVRVSSEKAPSLGAQKSKATRNTLAALHRI